MGAVEDRHLERQGRRMGRAGAKLLIASLIFGIPGLVLLIVGLAGGHTWMWAVGIALLLIAGGPATISFGLLGSGAVSRWAARHKLFA